MKKLLLLAVLALPLAAQPRIVFTKTFTGSVPEFVEIVMERDGSTTYKEADDETPVRFQLKQAQADEIFSLAEKLDKFQKQLESGLKGANMGKKTFRWMDGAAKKGEAAYNYSLDTNAQALQEWFEKIIETESHFVNLELAARFDKLGVNKVILLFNASYDRGRIVAPEQFLPLLDRIEKNSSYLNMDRERASNLAKAIRNPPAPTQP